MVEKFPYKLRIVLLETLKFKFMLRILVYFESTFFITDKDHTDRDEQNYIPNF